MAITLRQKFINECIKDPIRFERPIKKEKILTFATESGKHKLKKMVKQYLLVICVTYFEVFYSYHQKEKIDMAEVLSYSLTPVPLALCHIDGAMQKSQKSTLLKYLESKTINQPPITTNVTIIDAMLFLHLYTNMPPTFGGEAAY